MRRPALSAGGTTTVFYNAGNQVLLEKQGQNFTGVYTYGNALLRRNSEYPLYDGHESERTVTAGNQSVSVGGGGVALTRPLPRTVA